MTNELKGKVNYSVNGNIAILEVDNPPVNPLSSGVRAGLAELIEKANSDDSVKELSLPVLEDLSLLELIFLNLERVLMDLTLTQPLEI